VAEMKMLKWMCCNKVKDKMTVTISYYFTGYSKPG